MSFLQGCGIWIKLKDMVYKTRRSTTPGILEMPRKGCCLPRPTPYRTAACLLSTPLLSTLLPPPPPPPTPDSRSSHKINYPGIHQNLNTLWVCLWQRSSSWLEVVVSGFQTLTLLWVKLNSNSSSSLWLEGLKREQAGIGPGSHLPHHDLMDSNHLSIQTSSLQVFISK